MIQEIFIDCFLRLFMFVFVPKNFRSVSSSKVSALFFLIMISHLYQPITKRQCVQNLILPVSSMINFYPIRKWSGILIIAFIGISVCTIKKILYIVRSLSSAIYSVIYHCCALIVKVEQDEQLIKGGIPNLHYGWLFMIILWQIQRMIRDPQILRRLFLIVRLLFASLTTPWCPREVLMTFIVSLIT